MAKKFDVLRKQIDADPDRRQRVNEYKVVMDIITSLVELREAQHLTQTQLADRLHVKQPVISEFENSADMKLSTLLRYIEGLGGSLEIAARVDGKEVQLISA